jgi:hypothetical protein
MSSSSYFLRRVSLNRPVAAMIVGALLSGQAYAKAPELYAIEVYPQGDAQEYVQISGFTLNKNEVSLCSGEQRISKNAYGKLPKISLESGMSLEREASGVLMLTRGGQKECVVPANVKVDNDGATPSALAEKAELGGRIVTRSDSATENVPPLAPGVKIVLVPALDPEQAAFLRAERSKKIPVWQAYLATRSTYRVGEARAALAALEVQEGQAALAAYQVSLRQGEPDYQKLKASKTALNVAARMAPATVQSGILAAGIHQEAQALNGTADGELKLYQQAIKEQTAGYKHLLAAESVLNLTQEVDPGSVETVTLAKQCTQERKYLDARLVDSANKLSARRPDEAYEAIKPLHSFAGEYDDVQKHLNAIYSYHLQQGKDDVSKSDPQDAVIEFQKAHEVEATTEVAGLLVAAEAQARESTNHAAVSTALRVSTAAQEEDKDDLRAYEVLDDLSSQQKQDKEVADRLDSLKDRFFQKASDRAVELQRSNYPIRGVNNEVELEHAYDLLNRCFAIRDDPRLLDRMKVIGNWLSNYYLIQARTFLDLPNGAGTNVGWTYLVKASDLKAMNAEEVAAEMNRTKGAYQVRSRVSIGVKFRGSTSREADGLAQRLADSLVSNFEASGFAAKLAGPNEAMSVQPNFFLVGEVLEDSRKNSNENHPVKSQYRSAEPVMSAAWKAANREYESANDALRSAQEALSGAERRGKKKQIAEVQRQVADAQEKVSAARAKRDDLPQTHADAVDVSYTYTEQINELNAGIKLQFTILDAAGSVIVPVTPISVSKKGRIRSLEGVRPEDTTADRTPGEFTSEAQFLDQAEDEARTDLLKQASEKISALPQIILQSADRKAGDGDKDGAAELYMLYLNSTPSPATADKIRAQQFLLQNYNFRAYSDKSSKA